MADEFTLNFHRLSKTMREKDQFMAHPVQADLPDFGMPGSTVGRDIIEAKAGQFLSEMDQPQAGGAPEAGLGQAPAIGGGGFRDPGQTMTPPNPVRATLEDAGLSAPPRQVDYATQVQEAVKQAVAERQLKMSRRKLRKQSPGDLSQMRIETIPTLDAPEDVDPRSWASGRDQVLQDELRRGIQLSATEHAGEEPPNWFSQDWHARHGVPQGQDEHSQRVNSYLSLLGSPQEAGDSFTLTPGGQRYDSQGNLIAYNPKPGTPEQGQKPFAVQGGYVNENGEFVRTETGKQPRPQMIGKGDVGYLGPDNKPVYFNESGMPGTGREHVSGEIIRALDANHNLYDPGTQDYNEFQALLDAMQRQDLAEGDREKEKKRFGMAWQEFQRLKNDPASVGPDVTPQQLLEQAFKTVDDFHREGSGGPPPAPGGQGQASPHAGPMERSYLGTMGPPATRPTTARIPVLPAAPPAPASAAPAAPAATPASPQDEARQLRSQASQRIEQQQRQRQQSQVAAPGADRGLLAQVGEAPDVPRPATEEEAFNVTERILMERFPAAGEIPEGFVWRVVEAWFGEYR